MAYLKLDYSQLERAAGNAQKTASRLNTYATNIQNDVVSKSSNVTGGQNNNMSAVVTMATQKANALRQKAGKYEQLQDRLQKLRTNAETADNAVARQFKSDQRAYEQNLNWFEKILVHVHAFINGTVGESEFGRFLNNIGDGVRLVAQFKRNAEGIVRDFFVHGKGRYIVNIVLAVAAAVAAVAAIVGTGGAVLVAAVIAAAVAVGVAVATIIDNAIALSNEEDNPGFAKHMGSTDSMRSFAEKHFFDKDVQNFASGIDFIGHAASIFRDVGGLFKAGTKTVKTATGEYKKTVYKFKDSVVKENLMKEIGFVDSKELNPENSIKLNVKAKNGQAIKKTVRGSTYYLTPKSFFANVFGIGSNPESHSISWNEKAEGHRVLSTVNNTNKNVMTGIEEMRSLKKVIYGESDVKSVRKYVSKHIPVAGDIFEDSYDATEAVMGIIN